MYDTLFSEQWIFDRCVEGAHFEFILPIIITLVILALLFLLFRRFHFSKLKMSLSLIGLGVFILPFSLFLVQLTGYFVIGCSDGAFWKGVMAANELYVKVKYQCRVGNCPQTEEELKGLDQQLYYVMSANAKSNYTFYPTTQTYTWYVRPSAYYLVSFEGNGFGVFKIPEALGIHHWDVPEFKLSQDKLPNK